MGSGDIDRLYRSDNIVKARKAALLCTEANTFTCKPVGTLGLIQITITVRNGQIAVRYTAVLDAFLPWLEVFAVSVFNAVVLKLAEQLNANNAIENEKEEEEKSDAPNLLARFLEYGAVR